jgi:hypothetical protein
MSTSVHDGRQGAWWQEPTREQWHAWVAAWLGWTLDSFDFTIFVFIMLPISQEFHVPLSGTQIDAYNFETLLLAEDQVKRLVAQTKRVRCEDARAGGDAGRHEV